MRALAVLAVMGFHEGASELSGGFLGVDVFFVLSGFLITDLLASQYDRTGGLNLKDFWSRRARRLLPALALMLIVVTAAATVIEPGQSASLRPALLAAVTYTSNWYQILHHVSYFATLGLFTAPPPLDHLWSLAIEEQFYLIWPLLLWLIILRLNGRRARVTATLILAALSALAMALEYSPGDPSLVYYGTDTHASALLIGAALALALPLATVMSLPIAQVRRLDAAGVVGLVLLAWAAGHFSGNDRAVYPFGLILAAAGAAGLVAAAAGTGVIAAMTSLPPLRWVGIRSYGIYLWHWPVIALAGAITGPGPTSPWLWLIETGVSIALACASWEFVEKPILRDGFLDTCSRWRVAIDEGLRPVGPRRKIAPVVVAAGTLIAVAVGGYGVARPPGSGTPAGLLRQVAEGQRISAASEASAQASATGPASAGPSASPASSSPSPASSSPSPASSSPAAASSSPSAASSAPAAACRTAAATPPKVPGRQVTAIGDSVMVASAAALDATLPGIYINAVVGRAMVNGLAEIQGLIARHELRRYVVVGLGTNGPVNAAQIRQLRHLIGPDRDLILVNTYGPMPWESSVNTVLDAAARHTAHVSLADWYAAIAGHTSLLWPDRIHPQPAGARVYARTVLAAIAAQLSPAAAPSCAPQAGGPR
ncbi:MAG TPA: acyltransferase family protein [Streptosporangiaceae bacterium]|nr:acyltransferase family protein [Streptosporangiaceae bacterium]